MYYYTVIWYKKVNVTETQITLNFAFRNEKCRSYQDNW